MPITEDLLPEDHPIFSEPPQSFSHTSVLNWLASKTPGSEEGGTPTPETVSGNTVESGKGRKDE